MFLFHGDRSLVVKFYEESEVTIIRVSVPAASFWRKDSTAFAEKFLPHSITFEGWAVLAELLERSLASCKACCNERRPVPCIVMRPTA